MVYILSIIPISEEIGQDIEGTPDATAGRRRHGNGYGDLKDVSKRHGSRPIFLVNGQ